MGLVIQFQRRAIEKLRAQNREKSPLRLMSKFGSDIRFTVDGKPARCLGISEGIGTCSDIGGMDVAVFGVCGDTAPVRLNGHAPKALEAEYFVFLHNGTKLDKHGAPRATVELLECRPAEKSGQLIVFDLHPTGEIADYAYLI